MQTTNNTDLFQELEKFRALATENPLEEPRSSSLTVEGVINSNKEPVIPTAVTNATLAGNAPVSPSSSSYRFIRKLFVDQREFFNNSFLLEIYDG